MPIITVPTQVVRADGSRVAHEKLPSQAGGRAEATTAQEISAVARHCPSLRSAAPCGTAERAPPRGCCSTFALRHPQIDWSAEHPCNRALLHGGGHGRTHVQWFWRGYLTLTNAMGRPQASLACSSWHLRMLTPLFVYSNFFYSYQFSAHVTPAPAPVTLHQPAPAPVTLHQPAPASPAPAPAAGACDLAREGSRHQNRLLGSI